MRGLLDKLYHRIGQYLRMAELGTPCRWCAGGRAWYAGRGIFLTPYYHKIDGKLVKCSNPWFQRRKPATDWEQVDDSSRKD